MFDIGFGEFVVLGILALMVFGPEKLPSMARDAGRALRQLRELSQNARAELSEASGADEFSELKSMADDLRALNPRRMVDDLMIDPATDEVLPPAAGAVTAAGVVGSAGYVAPEQRKSGPPAAPGQQALPGPQTAAATESRPAVVENDWT